MRYDFLNKHRHSIRLPGADYSVPGFYFVTICTNGREHLFGKIVDGDVQLSEIGKIAKKCWLEIPNHYQKAIIDEFVIMPNHVHGIIEIVDRNVVIKNVGVQNVGVQDIEPLPTVKPLAGIVGAQYLVPRSPLLPHLPLPSQSPRQNQYQHIVPGSIGAMVRGFKIGVTKWCRAQDIYDPVWQRNYYKHIIRHNKSLERIRQYIRDNPFNWAMDIENTNVSQSMPEKEREKKLREHYEELFQ